MLQQSIRIPALLTLKLFNLKIRSTVKECKEQLWRCWIGNVRNYTGDFLQGFIHRFICENSCFRSLIMKRKLEERKEAELALFNCKCLNHIRDNFFQNLCSLETHVYEQKQQRKNLHSRLS